MQESMDELVQKYSRRGHPSLEELISAQGLTLPRYLPQLQNRQWLISFMTEAELEQWAEPADNLLVDAFVRDDLHPATFSIG